MPNGFEADGTTLKFDEVIIDNDTNLSVVWGTAGSVLIYLTPDKRLTQIGLIPDRVSSGPTAPTATNKQLWYDTTNNIIKQYTNGSADLVGCSFPLALCTKTDSADSTLINSIDQVFNGFGYIGGYGFVLPNVKFLIPNGRNTDGTLKNIKFTTSTVQVRQVQYGGNTYRWWIQPNGFVQIFYITELIISETPPTREGRTEWYKPSENLHYMRSDSSSPWIVYTGANFAIATGVPNSNVTEFKPKTPFHALDYNDKSDISGWGMPSNKYIDLTLGASGTTYTAPANGWFTIRYDSTNNGYCSLTNVTANLQSVSQGVINCLQTPCKKGDVMNVDYTANVFYFFRFIYAEGEQ